MGRRSKLTPDIAALILNAIREGNHIRDVAAAAGLHHSTIYEWHNRGEAERDIPINPKNYTKNQLLAIADAQLVDWDHLGIDTNRARKATLARHVYQPTPYTEFSDAYTRARGEAMTFAVTEMRRVGQRDWRMWHAFLAAMDPERWGRAALEPAAGDAGVSTGELLQEGKVVLRAIDGSAERVAG